MAKMRQMRELSKILTSQGWSNVYNDHSGIYYKNGYLLIYGDEHDTQLDGIAMENVFSRYLREELLGASDWLIEHDGFVVAMGNITPRLLDACSYGDSDNRYKDWLKQITCIQETISMSRNQELQQRKAMGFRTTQGNVVRYVAHDGPVRDTMVFKFTQSREDFQEGQILRVVGVNGGKIQIVDVNSNEAMVFEPQDYKEFEQDGTIVAVEPMVTVGKVQVKGLVQATDGPIADIPGELFKYHVSDRQLLSKGVAACVNVTPLLVPSICATEELLSALSNTSDDMRPLLDASIPVEAAEGIAQVVRSQLNLARFIGGAVDAEYLQLQLRDFDYEFEAVARGKDSTTIALVREMYSYGVQEFEDDVFKQYVKFKGSRLRLSTDFLLANGLRTSSNVFVRWGTIKDRAELYAYYSSGKLTVQGRPWSEWLTRIMDNGMYFAFDARRGFILQVGNYWLGRDYNSLVFYNTVLNPVWRAIEVNETFIQYGDFPVKYLFA